MELQFFFQLYFSGLWPHGLYLPFLGTYLQRPTDADYTQPETMQPSSQVLLLYYIYRNIDHLYLSDTVQELGYSAMTIREATRQLVELGLMLECKNGVQKIIYTENSHRDLFQQALPYLSTPVKRERYVPINTILSPHLLAGISALAEHSMLNPEIQSVTECTIKQK